MCASDNQCRDTVYLPLRGLIRDMTRSNPDDRWPSVAAACECLSAMTAALQRRPRPALRPLDNKPTALQSGSFPAKRVTPAADGAENVSPQLLFATGGSETA